MATSTCSGDLGSPLALEGPDLWDLSHSGFDLQTLPVAAALEWRLSQGQVGKKWLVQSRELESIKKKIVAVLAESGEPTCFSLLGLRDT